GQILRNFLTDVCGCTGAWRMETFLERTVADLRERVGKDRVIVGLSGGVDSAGTAAVPLEAGGPPGGWVLVGQGPAAAGGGASRRNRCATPSATTSRPTCTWWTRGRGS